MTDQLPPSEMREAAKRLRNLLEVEGGTYGSRSDISAGADALEALADVIEYAEFRGDWIDRQYLAHARGETNERETP